MSLIPGYGQSLFTTPQIAGVDHKQQKLDAATWRASTAVGASDMPVRVAKTGAAQGLVQGQTLFAAQSIAQDTKDLEEASASGKTEKEKFLEYQQMSTADKYRAMFLGQMDLTEEELAALPPEEREKIEAQLREKIKEALEEDMRKKQQENQQ